MCVCVCVCIQKDADAYRRRESQCLTRPGPLFEPDQIWRRVITILHTHTEHGARSMENGARSREHGAQTTVCGVVIPLRFRSQIGINFIWHSGTGPTETEPDVSGNQ